MNWPEALAAMQAGHSVRRKSESWTRVIDHGNPEMQGAHWTDGIEHAGVYESGQEGCKLMHAWTVEEKPVIVFMGSSSKCLFAPEDEHRNATDWEIEA